MALKGDTSNLLLADIFQTLFQNGQSGILHLRSSEHERRVLFAPHGVTLFDAHAFRADRLAHLLVAGRLITPEIANAAVAEIHADDGESFSSIKLLVVLEDEGHLELKKGVAVLRTEVREELFEVFALERMEFEFVSDPVPAEGIPKECYFRPEEVVMEAARRVDEWDRIRQVVGKGDRYYVAGDGPPMPELDAILAMLDGTNTTIDISEALLISRFEVARVVAKLLEVNRLRPATIDELLKSAATAHPRTARARIERLLHRAVTMLDKSDARLDDAAEIAIRADIRGLAIQILVQRARALFAAGHPEASYTEALRARELDNHHLDVLQLLVEIHRARGERPSEVKILTILAERAAAEQRFDVAVEHAARVAELVPDSPLLDNAFIHYCQGAGRADFGAEVLSRAAGLRENKARAAVLYRGILTLDPTRSDIRKLLHRQQKKVRRGRVALAALAVAVLPAAGFGARYLYGRFERERLNGRIQAIEQLVNDEEWTAARAALNAIQDGDLDAAALETVAKLRKTTEEKLEEKDEQKRSRNLSDAREELSAIQDDLDARRFAPALDRLVAMAAEGGETSSGDLIAAKRKVLARSLEEFTASLDSRARDFAVPEDDSRLAPALEAFERDFGSEQREDLTRVVQTMSKLRHEDAWRELATSIGKAATTGATAIDKVLPGLSEIRERIERNAALDLLSDDFDEILAAESAGDFAKALAGYNRLLREYGSGKLATYFTERRAAVEKVDTGLREVRDLCDLADAEGAAARMRLLIEQTTDFDLVNTIGIPHRIVSLPSGADATFGGKPAGRTPCVIWVKGLEGVAEVTVNAIGFREHLLTLEGKSPPQSRIELRRDCRFTTRLTTGVEAAPATDERHVFVGARDGALYRLDRTDGRPDGEFRSKSLAGVSAPPLIAHGSVLVPLGEGAIAVVDAESLKERATIPLDSMLVGVPLLDDRKLLCATERGAVIEIDVTDGTARSIAALDVALRSGPARIGNAIAVGCVTGEVIAIDPRDGSIVFRTSRTAQPIVGIVAAGSRFVAADDSGVLTALDPTTGAVAWQVDGGDAAAAPPAIQDGLLLFAAGKRALVLDAADGTIRFDVEALDWICATPALAGGRLYVCDRSGAFDAFDVNTRERVFRHKLSAPAHAQPIVLSEGVLVVASDGEVSIVGT